MLAYYYLLIPTPLAVKTGLAKVAFADYPETTDPHMHYAVPMGFFVSSVGARDDRAVGGRRRWARWGALVLLLYGSALAAATH